MIRFYLSMECHSCEEGMFLGPVATTITHNGLPVVPYDFASQESFCCDNCGTEHILGDFDYLVEGGDEDASDDEEEVSATAVAIGEDGTAYLDDDTEVPAGEWEEATTA